MNFISLKALIFLLVVILLVDSVISTPVLHRHRKNHKKGHHHHHHHKKGHDKNCLDKLKHFKKPKVPSPNSGETFAPNSAAPPAPTTVLPLVAKTSTSSLAKTSTTPIVKIAALPVTHSATPTPTPTPSPTPSPSPKPKPSPAPVAAAAAAPPASSGDHSGAGTFFTPGLGACGITDNSNSLMVALAAPDFDPHTPNGNPNENTLCGKSIRIFRNGKSVDALVHDRCPVCNGGDVDMSPAVFDQIAQPSEGRVTITWEFL